MVTGRMPNASISTSGSNITLSGSGTVSEGTISWTGSSTMTPSVITSGYISSTEGEKKTSTISASHSIALLDGSVNSESKDATPVISKLDKTKMSGLVDASSGDPTTTKPQSGVYVGVNTSKLVTTITPSLNLRNDSFYNKSNCDKNITINSGSVTTKSAADTYIPVTSGEVKIIDSI